MSPALRARALDDVVVARSGDCPKVLRFRRRVEQRSAESHWYNIISVAVDEKDRGLNSRDLPARIEAPDEQWTDHWQYGSRNVAGRGEGRLQDDPSTLENTRNEPPRNAAPARRSRWGAARRRTRVSATRDHCSTPRESGRPRCRFTFVAGRAPCVE